jgi:hypothetical protein
MKNLEIVFFLITIICFIFLIIGLVKPNAVIYWGTDKNKTRKKVLVYYGLPILIFFVAFVASNPELSPEEKAELAMKRVAEEKLEAESKTTQPMEKEDEKASLWSKAVNPVSNMVKSAASYIMSDDPLKSEKRQFSEEEIKKLLEEQVYLTLEDKWFGTDYFKRTLEVADHMLSGEIYIYSGEMKENKPHGKGILFTISDSDLFSYGRVFTLLYAGNFKEGVYNGYGVKYQKASSYYNDDYKALFTRASVDISLDQLGISYPQYEGYFKDGKFEGKGKYTAVDDKVLKFDEQAVKFESTYLNEYSKANEKSIKEFETELHDESSAPIHVSTLPPLDTYVYYEGEFKKDKYNGEGTLFYQNGDIKYEGEFKNGGYSGKGKLFFESKQLQYEGEFINGKYHGKGTLYKEDGSVKYKGQWDSGDVKG